MDIGGTAKKIQRATKVAEESYKKMNEIMGQVQEMQEDLTATSEQVDRMEQNLAKQRVLLEALAETEDIDPEEVLAEADIPESPREPGWKVAGDDASKMATSRPSEVSESE